MIIKTVILLLCGSCPIAVSQGVYPLQIGNQWDYGEIDFHTPGRLHYLYSVHCVGDTTMPNGLKYAVVDGDIGPRFMRQSGARVSAFLLDRDSLVYDFSLNSGDTVTLARNGDYFTLVTVNVGQAQMFGMTLNSWSFVRTTNASSDGGSRLTIADGLGRTYIFVDGGYSDYLMGARIDGKQYGELTHTAGKYEPNPKQFSLMPSYPNPFNPTTTVLYRVPIRAEVRIILYSSLGQEVSTLYQGLQSPGAHTARIDGTDLASGVYYLRLFAPGVSLSRAVVLVK